MVLMILRKIILFCALADITLTVTAMAGPEHPFMIVRTAEYEALRARSLRWPWSIMKSKALSDAKNLADVPGADITARCERIHAMASSCALAFILDPDNRPLYASRFETAVAPGLHALRLLKGNRTEHEYNVPPAHTAFMVYLALDILYDDLNPARRLDMEMDCDHIADSHVDSWETSGYAIKAMKELYHNGRSAAFVTWKNRYRDITLGMTTADGVSTTGPGYAKSRIFMDERMQKKIFMDICEYQGYTEFYRNPRLAGLYEWVFGYSVTPFNRSYTFGDTPPTKDLDDWAVSALRAGRFSSLAGRLARYRLGPLTDKLIQGRLLHYVLCDSVVQTGQRPGSRIFRNGGAWLLQDTDSTTALAGALWNINTDVSSHNHYDVNSLHVAAYNAHVLRNSGYDGYGEPDAATWAWIAKTAESSNTVLWDGRNHVTWKGGGISEHLIGGEWEYASSSSGSALALARHVRNLFFLKPRPGFAHGYFVVTDQVKPIFNWGGTAKVNVVWHPNSALQPQMVQDTYRWPMQGCNYGGINVGIDILPVNPPETSEIRNGYLASYETCSRFRGTYLYNTYGLNQGQANVATVLFPFDRKHTSAVMTRLAVTDAAAASIDHGGGVVDYVVAPAGGRTVEYGETAVNGHTVLWRNINNRLDSYFITAATLFLHNNGKSGVTAEKSVTLYMAQDRGQIVSPGTAVTFFAEHLAEVQVDGVPVPASATGENWLQVQVDSGVHALQLIRRSTRVLQQGSAYAVAMQVYPNPSNEAANISFQLAEAGQVMIEIFNLHGRRLAVPVNGWYAAGRHEYTWQAKGLASGLYFCRLRSSSGTMVQKIMVQK